MVTRFAGAVDVLSWPGGALSLLRPDRVLLWRPYTRPESSSIPRTWSLPCTRIAARSGSAVFPGHHAEILDARDVPLGRRRIGGRAASGGGDPAPAAASPGTRRGGHRPGGADPMTMTEFLVVVATGLAAWRLFTAWLAGRLGEDRFEGRC